MRGNQAAGATVYRLRGAERCFDLSPGEHRVGGSHDSDIRLRDKGVSRQHAVLTVTSSGLVVEDRGSLNGTFVDDLRVDRAAVPADAELRFGRVRLRLECLDADDSEIAIVGPVLSSPLSQPETGSSVLETITQVTGQADPLVPGAWLDLVEGFAWRHRGGKHGPVGGDRGARYGLSRALEWLVVELGLTGACVLELSPGPGGPTTVVLASAGTIGDLPNLESSSNGDPNDVLTMAGGPSEDGMKGTHYALLTWGDFEGRPAGSKLLGVLLRLVERFVDDEAPSQCSSTQCASKGRPEIVFPEGYRRLSSPAMDSLYRQMRSLASGELPVLIVGETGVGKGRLARMLHTSSERHGGAFVAVNCAAIPAELLEAEMFGIGKGVATGVDRRPGKFQLAEGGTLFLDEIGEMAPELQAKLLRALQEKEVQPVGGRAIPIDVRVVAATNAELGERMRAGLFRRDLYYRLAGDVLEVPPLRQCREDVPALIEHFLESFAGDSGRRVRGVTVKALRLLSAYGWPGNVRQLEHEVRRLVARCGDGRAIDSKALSAEVLRGGGAPRPSIPLDPLRLEPRIRELEVELVREALRRTDGNLTRAAGLLGLSRFGLSKKLKRLGVLTETAHSRIQNSHS